MPAIEQHGSGFGPEHVVRDEDPRTARSKIVQQMDNFGRFRYGLISRIPVRIWQRRRC